MPPFGPITRPQLGYYLRRLGFDGPYPGGKHSLMIAGTTRITIPNPHRSDISGGLPARIPREAGISRDEWERL